MSNNLEFSSDVARLLALELLQALSRAMEESFGSLFYWLLSKSWKWWDENGKSFHISLEYWIKSTFDFRMPKISIFNSFCLQFIIAESFVECLIRFGHASYVCESCFALGWVIFDCVIVYRLPAWRLELFLWRRWLATIENVEKWCLRIPGLHNLCDYTTSDSGFEQEELSILWRSQNKCTSN